MDEPREPRQRVVTGASLSVPLPRVSLQAKLDLEKEAAEAMEAERKDRLAKVGPEPDRTSPLCDPLSTRSPHGERTRIPIFHGDQESSDEGTGPGSPAPGLQQKAHSVMMRRTAACLSHVDVRCGGDTTLEWG